MSTSGHAFSPDALVILASVGICFIFWELNRPGRILPGAAGLLAFLLAAASLSHHALRWQAAVLLVAGIALLVANLRLRLHSVLLGVASLALVAGLRLLIAPGEPHPVHTPTALACGLAVGVLGAFLSRVALRARRAKAVN